MSMAVFELIMVIKNWKGQGQIVHDNLWKIFTFVPDQYINVELHIHDCICKLVLFNSATFLMF